VLRVEFPILLGRLVLRVQGKTGGQSNDEDYLTSQLGNPGK
jgi:hypothetical protein